MFFQQLECDTGDRSVSLTSFERANRYTLYGFKKTDGHIGPATYGPRFKSAMGSARLEVSFLAAVNENIKVVIFYQMLGRLEFERFNAVLVFLVLAVDFTIKKSIVLSQDMWLGYVGLESSRATSCLT